MHIITDLATTTVFAVVENKMPNIVLQSKKSDYDTNINEIENKITTDHDHDKFITTQEFNTFKTSENFASRLGETNLANKSDIANFVKETDFNDKLKNYIKMLFQIKQNIDLLKIN